jgi:hypothetical protein
MVGAGEQCYLGNKTSYLCRDRRPRVIRIRSMQSGSAHSQTMSNLFVVEVLAEVFGAVFDPLVHIAEERCPAQRTASPKVSPGKPIRTG